MIYELWTVSSFGPGEPLMPLICEARDKSFDNIYEKFKKLNKSAPCVIILDSLNKTKKTSDKIYESPDGGETVYERDFLNYNNRTMKKDNKYD